jgi:hypothetical protein
LRRSGAFSPDLCLISGELPGSLDQYSRTIELESRESFPSILIVRSFMFDGSTTFGADPSQLEMIRGCSSVEIQRSQGLIMLDVFSSHAIVSRCRLKSFDQFQ